VTDTFPTSGGNPLLHKTTEDAAVGILLAFASADVSFQADVRNDLRDGPYPSTNTANVDSSVTTDDLPVNDSLDDLVDVFTVPDAPVLEDAEGGNGQIAVVWRRGTNPTGGDPDGVAGYDVILTPTSPAGPAVICFFDGDAPNAQTGTKFSHICTGLVNGTTYQVSVAARNGAGESDRSNALTAKPCAACAVAVVPNPEQLTIITGDTSGGVGGPGCEQLLKDRKLGATAGNPIIVCDEYPAAETDGNGGLIASVREDPATLGACGAFTCVGGIQFTSNVPFDITNFLREVVIIDKTLLPDNADKSVFVDGVLIGTSDKNSWCTAAPPNFAFGCVEKIATLNKKTAPNGSQGVADLLVVIRFSVNPSKGVGAR
jgi:hypothetical protein